MNNGLGEKSFNPKELSIYYYGIDFARINVWELFKRKLPGQIALICYSNAKSISEISLEVGCSSCYIEEEVEILLQAGVLIESVKNKYRTNFYILNKVELNEVRKLYKKMYAHLSTEISNVFNERLEDIKATNVYSFNASIEQYKWIFVHNIADLDRRNIYTHDSDYPRILSCGSRGLLYGIESEIPKYVCGQTSTDLGTCIVWAKDYWNLTKTSTNQPILRDKKVAQTVIDVYNEKIDNNKNEMYAMLIKNRILKKVDGKLKCNLAYINSEFKNLMESINIDLYKKMECETNEIRQYLTKIISKNIPNNLKEYINGYVVTLMDFLANNMLIEELIENNFIHFNDAIQISYFTNK